MQPQYSVPIKDFLHSTTGAAASLFLPPIKKFAILSSGRSGSNLLISLLKSHSRIVQHGEIFGEFQLESPLVRRRINQAGVCAYLDRRLSRLTTEQISGVKLLYNNIEPRYGEVRGIPGTGDLLKHLQDNSSIRIIQLQRQDKLALLISMRLANALQQWVSGSYGDKTVHMSVEWVHEQLTWLERWEARIVETFPEDRLCQMTYEALAAKTQDEMHRLFAFLGIEPAPVHTRMSKQNTRSKSEVIENYDELREAFHGTAYASLFCEELPPAG